MKKFKYALNIDLLESRLSEIESSLTRLEELKKEYSSKKKFLQTKDSYGIVEHHLRRSLEGLLSCGSHILSRIPGARFDEYATIATQLVEQGILPTDFKETAIKMAKYRNRLVHFYHEVNKDELYEILQNYLGDLRQFYQYFLKLLRF